jgi:hypothetical protein
VSEKPLNYKGRVLLAGGWQFVSHKNIPLLLLLLLLLDSRWAG